MDNEETLWTEARTLMAAYGGEYPCERGEFGRWLPGECEYADRCEEREPIQCWRLLAALAGVDVPYTPHGEPRVDNARSYLEPRRDVLPAGPRAGKEG